MQKIGTQNGIEAARLADKASDPKHPMAYDKRAMTLQTLVAGHNETASAQKFTTDEFDRINKRLDTLEAALRPFVSSTASAS